MKQAAFLAALALTGSVRAAAQRVGMSRETAYRLRRKEGAQSFARAWHAALRRVTDPARKVTRAERPSHFDFNLLKPLIYAGRHVATIVKPHNDALFRFVSQLNRSARANDPSGGGGERFAPRSGSTGRAPPRGPLRR